jgi:hypothetical protein
MSPSTSHLTSLDFDRLRLEALLPDEAAALRGHLDTCDACRQQEQSQLALAHRFLHEVLPRTLPVIRERLEPAAGSHRRWIHRWAFALAPLACGLALLVFWGHGTPRNRAVAPADDVADIALKGGGGLLAYVRQGTSIKRLENGAVLAPGDALRFAVDVGANNNILIAGVDGSGKANAYFPYGQWQGAALPAGARFEVPGSIVLDDSPGPERIFAFLSKQPLDGAAIRTRLETLARLGAQAIRATSDVDVAGSERSSVIFEKKAKAP